MTLSDDLERFQTEAALYFDEILRTAMRLTRNRDDAEDLVQETMLQAWRSFGKYEAGTNCRAWLHAILRHKYGQFHRKRAIRAKYFAETDETTPEPVGVSNLESIFDAAARRDIARAIKRLPEHYLEVVMLTDFYQYEYREAADILGIPIGTVMSRLNRGRRRLRDRLRPAARDFGLAATS
jgi:RNA polymerase sigma-70 factor (ECF subfamily)